MHNFTESHSQEFRSFLFLPNLWATYQDCHQICLLTLMQHSQDPSHFIHFTYRNPYTCCYYIQESILQHTFFLVYPWQQQEVFNWSKMQQLESSLDPTSLITFLHPDVFALVTIQTTDNFKILLLTYKLLIWLSPLHIQSYYSIHSITYFTFNSTDNYSSWFRF